MIKTLLLVGGKRYDITNDLKNWDEIEISAKRKGFGGVVRSFGNKFEFAKDAYSLLENEYLANYTKASATLVIGVLNNEWTYNEKFRCKLDFATYQSDGTTLTMNAIDDSIAAVISANKSQVYDIPVAELKGQELHYDRIELMNRSSFFLNPNVENTTGDDSISIVSSLHTILMSFPIAYGDPNFPVNRNILELKDSYGEEWLHFTNDNLEHYFIKALENINIKINLSFSSISEIVQGTNASYYILIKRWVNSDTSLKVDTLAVNNTTEWKIFNRSYEFVLKEGDVVTMTLEREDDLWVDHPVIIKIKDFQMNVSYNARNKPVRIDTFAPQKLITSILHKMGLSNVTGVVEEGNIDIPWMLAAESIRGFKDAKVHTSFSKFTDFIKSVLGYEYQIEGNKVIFKHLSKFYDNTQVKELEYANSLELSVDQSLIYSGVDVGYDKKGYDEINGRDEFHFTNSFTTGLSINDNVLKLISPYRADCYGIEFLANKRDEETKDDSADNDLFFVNAEKRSGNTYLILNRSSRRPTGVLFPDSIFNIAYSPRRMLLANKEYIGACASSLIYTASNGNADAVLDGVSEKEDILIADQDRLFRIETLKVDTVGLSPFPGNYQGIVTFDFAGREYEGYISDINEKIGKLQTTTYGFICRKIE